MKDVVPWAKAHLNVLADPKYWTVAGYSDGGACASYLGAKYPSVFGDILDISGTEFAGTEQEANVLKSVFHSSQAAYDAIKPITIMTTSTYPDTTAIYTVGQNDPTLAPGLKRTSEQATRSGIASSFVVIPGADHGAAALNGGLDRGFALLYPRLGLSPAP
jgi:enterochelin esterase-like enzyme